MSHSERTHEKIAYDVRLFRESLGYSAGERLYGPDLLARFIARYPNIRIQQVSENELPSSEAQAIPIENLIRIRGSVFRALKQGDSRAAMTLAHEICHIVYKHDGALNRSLVKSYLLSKTAAQEREAKYFAAELFAPTEASLDCSSPDELVSRFGLSREAAKVRWDELERVRRQRARIQRPIPAATKLLMDDLFTKFRHKPKYPQLRSEAPAPKLPELFGEHVKAHDARIQGFSPYPCPQCNKYTVVKGSGCETCDCGYTSCE